MEELPKTRSCTIFLRDEHPNIIQQDHKKLVLPTWQVLKSHYWTIHRIKWLAFFPLSCQLTGRTEVQKHQSIKGLLATIVP